MQEPDVELENWRRQWQADQTIPSDLKQKVESDTRKMKRARAWEIVVTVLMGGGSLLWAVSSHSAEIAALAIGIWVLIAIAWTASLRLYRGAWEPTSASITDFVEISILRTQRHLQATVVQVVLYVIILTFDLVWLYYYLDPADLWTLLSRPIIVAVFLVVTPALACLVVWYRRRLRLELQSLNDLRRQLHNP